MKKKHIMFALNSEILSGLLIGKDYNRVSSTYKSRSNEDQDFKIDKQRKKISIKKNLFSDTDERLNLIARIIAWFSDKMAESFPSL